MPSTAALVKEAIGNVRAPAMDVSAACSGFVYAYATAHAHIAAGMARHVLVIGAEVLSRWVDMGDRSTCILFGDGAGAVVLEASDLDSVRSLNLGADGSLAELIYADHGGFIHMDGREVFRRAVRVVVDSAESALRDAGVTIDDISLVLAHQANQRILAAVADRLGVDFSKVEVCLDSYGNTSSASIPLAVDQARRAGRLHEGDTVLMTGFGAGMTWASAVVTWS